MKQLKLQRHPGNPIVWAGKETWRRIVTFNPGAIIDDDGTFYLLERAVSSLARCTATLAAEKRRWCSFELAHPEPIFDAKDLNTPTARLKIRAS